MDQAQLQSVIRSLLIAAGAAVAGTWLAPYFTASNMELAVAVIVPIAMAVWGHQSNTPIALAQKLVSNPRVSNDQAGRAIMSGYPERVQTLTTAVTK